MQVTHNNLTPEFQPIELTITIESAEELASIYAALNVHTATLAENNSMEPAVSNDCYMPLFDVLATVANERGYLK